MFCSFTDEENSELREAFDSIDKDNSSDIGAYELAVLSGVFDGPLDPSEFQLMKKAVSKSQDREISFEEFTRLDQLVKAWGVLRFSLWLTSY